MHIQELVVADLPALLELCIQSLPYDQWTIDLLNLRIFHDPEETPDYRLCIYDDATLVGAVVAVRRYHEQIPYGGILLIVVHPAFRRRHIATALLDQLEARMRRDGIHSMVVGGTPPNFFWAGVDLRYTPALCLFEKRSYIQGDVYVNMLVDLQASNWDTAAEQERLQAAGFTIRRLSEADRTAFSEWLLQTWSPGWHAEAIESYRNNPITTFIALQDNQIQAFATYNVEGFNGHFGPTGTAEVLRGNGLGRVLFFCCMEDLQKHGLTSAEIVWVGPIAFYAHIAHAVVHRAFWHLSCKFD